MKTISIFAYDINVVEDFLYIFNPMVRKPFNFEVFIYTSFLSPDTIGDVGITDNMIRDLTNLKSKYCWVHELKIHGLVTTGPDVTPEPQNIDNFVDFLYTQKEDLELSGHTLECDFEIEHESQKSNYTEMAIKLSNKIAPDNVHVDVGSYKHSTIDMWKIYNENIKVINTGMYSVSLCTFYKELYNMLASPLNRVNQIPAVSFSTAHVAMNTRMKRLRQFGYNSVAIFDPNGSDNMYARDIADFIETPSWNRLTIPTIIGIGSSLIIGGMPWGVLWFADMLLVAPVLQFWIVSGIGALSMITSFILCCRMVSMVRYTLWWFTTVTSLLSIMWLVYLYGSVQCGGVLFTLCGVVNETTFGLPRFLSNK